MSTTIKPVEAAGVHETARSLAENLRQYIEAQYHIRDEGLIRERRALLVQAATVAQIPYVEATAVYKVGDPYESLPIPSAAIDVLTELSRMDVGLYPRPYEHQSQALASFLGEEAADLVVATGTGSGKTESFLMPIIGQLAIEGAQRPESAALHGCRAMLLYPMNALVNDQLARIRRLFGNAQAAEVLSRGRTRPIRFGSYTGRTPYPGRRSATRDERFIKPLFEEFYHKVAEQPTIREELERIGRWPSKDLEAFYGQELVESRIIASGPRAGQARASNNWDSRLVTQHGDRELMTRHEMQERCPELLITNYSMLEYMLMRPIERRIFAQTRDWLRADPRNAFTLVLDEAHMYRGAGGAEVALLIRRLCARLEIPRERMRCILTSASLGNGPTALADGERFARDLTGLAPTSARRVRVIQGTPEPRSAARGATDEEAQALADFDLQAFENAAADLGAARQAATRLAARLGWKVPGEGGHESFRDWLFSTMTGFGPLEKLIAAVSGKAVRLDALSQMLFPGSPSATAEQAVDALLALGSHARRQSDGRVLIPTRLHLFHRGLPGLYACVNPQCSARLVGYDSPTILGRLHTKPLDRCSCTSRARVYELYTHRDCGAAFLRGYVTAEMDFVWHQPSGPLSAGQTVDLIPVEMLVEERVHPRSSYKDMWLHIPTGRLSVLCPPNAIGYRRVRVPDMPAASGADMRFDECPVCMRSTRGGRDEPSKIMDHVTKGEAPFTTLVRTQMDRQPASRPIETARPNGGRKVLIFSDGRQKAARLARDIPRDIELDVFRRAIARACRRLEKFQEPRPNQNLYIAFLSVLCEDDLSMFDGEDARKVAAARAEFIRDCEGDLAEAFDGFSPTEPAPSRYRIALLKLLGSTYYSLSGTTVGFVEPAKVKLGKLRESFKVIGLSASDEDVRALAVAWIEGLLQDFAFDSSLDPVLRSKAAGYYKPIWGSKGQFRRLLREALARRAHWSRQLVEVVESTFRNQLATEKDGAWFLAPNALRLRIDLDHVWAQCQDCTVLTPLGLGQSTCLACGGDSVRLVDPATSDYIAARKNFWRQPVRETLDGGRLLNLSVEEHTAQLSNRDRSSVHATTERYELRFQDVLLEEADRPIDVLSCTTTMEVGVDIGSLVAVALRNVPPQRENYQQRAGRAGRRGASVSTVVTYSQTGPHDSHYFLNPASIVAGDPRTPEVKVDNPKIARRHVHAYLIQTFFHERMSQGDCGPSTQTSSLEKALGPTRIFFHGARDTRLTLEEFDAWVSRRVLASNGDLRASVAAWLPPALDTGGELIEQWLATTAESFLATLHELGKKVPRPAAVPHGTAGKQLDSTVGDESMDEEASDTIANPQLEQEELLEFLFFHGLLPSYAFPTSLCSFLVEQIGRNGKGMHDIRTVQRPQQSISQALSEYAPGRLIVIDKKTYRSAGVFADVPVSEVNRARPLFAKPKRLVHCKACSFVRDPHATQASGQACPVCDETLMEETMIEPEVFGPENARELPDDDREQEITYATMAQFPQPVDPEAFTFVQCGPNARYTHATDRRLVVVNRGKEGGQIGGFSVCVECGKASVFDAYHPAGGPHDRPYRILNARGVDQQCKGEFRRVFLGHDFSTDLMLVRIRLAAPLVTDTSDKVVLHMLEGALHTIAEALRLAASRHRQLDIDPAEFGSGFRIVPALQEGARMVDLFLYDTLSGGAGYAEVAARNLPKILDATLTLLEGCSCDTSCTECLNHFHNQHIQERLDRKLGASLLRYAIRGEAPRCGSPVVQAATLSQLRASLELDGYCCTEGGTPDMPLVVEREGRRLAVGCYPGLLARPEFVHAIEGACGMDGHLALNEFLLRSNLPDAHQMIRAKFRESV
ncbi:DEAD/DEAH box helicase [Cupriavidus sp. DB3]|uniref:DEAD/DEAH box helicase n=1 Tax=Cupriavidus sp. DB3 TaxID=2873259 RepID=UPI001CF46E0A|nr:DEAD/DEAH box helicase [Cupriavidus sp. DB3]MCA7082379.1 DEAD/DEAH box helicase [Cupriavidus sp. DB3]